MKRIKLRKKNYKISSGIVELIFFLQIDVSFQISDPYRWLEMPDSDETRQFIEAENEITQKFTRNCNEWQKIADKLTTLHNYQKYGTPTRHGNYYYSFMNSGLQNQL